MIKPLVLLTVLFVPVMAFGQDGRSRLAVDAAVAASLAAIPPLPDEAQATAQPRSAPAANEAPRRRRPSMVGYVGDASIGSQLRVRFDTGFEVQAADRAEFFYAKCGCYRGLPPTNPAYDPDAPGPGPGILTEADYSQLFLLGEYAVNNRVSVFGELPVRWLRPQAFAPGTGSFDSSSGLSDFRGGVKAGLISTPTRQVTVQLQAMLPTGDAGLGLGTDHASVEPAVLYFEQVNSRVAIEAQFGDVIPIGGSAGVPTTSPNKFAGNVLYYGIGPSIEVYANDRLRIAPVVELVGWRVTSGYQTADRAPAEGTNIVNLKVGTRFTMRDRSSVYIGYGLALTDAVWYDDILRVEYRLTF